MVRLSSVVIEFLNDLDKEVVGGFSQSSMSDGQSFFVFVIDIVRDLLGDWAELNDPRDASRFILGTKAETLGRLAGSEA